MDKDVVDHDAAYDSYVRYGAYAGPRRFRRGFSEAEGYHPRVRRAVYDLSLIHI